MDGCGTILNFFQAYNMTLNVRVPYNEACLSLCHPDVFERKKNNYMVSERSYGANIMYGVITVLNKINGSLLRNVATNTNAKIFVRQGHFARKAYKHVVREISHF